MGRILRPAFEQILPTQGELEPSNFKQLLTLYDDGRFDQLLPGIVQPHYGKLALIQGTHRHVMYFILGRKSHVFLPRDYEDFFNPKKYDPKLKAYVQEINDFIRIRFNYPVGRHIRRLKQNGISTIADLCDAYEFKSIDDIKQYAHSSQPL